MGPEVRVNGISPGPIADTEGMKRLAPDAETRQTHYDRIAMKRWGTIEVVAESAVFLWYPAAGYIHGTILDCDGGRQIGDASSGDLAGGMARILIYGTESQPVGLGLSKSRPFFRRTTQ